MACSEVSGVCGLIKSIDPTITQDRMRSLLEATATDLNTSPGTTPGFDVFSGFGIVNVSAALPVLKLSADEVDLGKTGLHTLVQTQNVGGKGSDILIQPPLTQTVVQGTPGWLSTTIAADAKTILLDADRTALADGPYQIRVDVTTNGGNGSFLVDLTQDAAITSPQDVGTVTIQLFASDGVTLVTSTTANAANGYAFHLPLVPLGKYFLKAGTDVNQNGVLGEAGELFGAYPRGALPEPLELDKMTSFHLDMVVK
jgi:serine protease